MSKIYEIEVTYLDSGKRGSDKIDVHTLSRTEAESHIRRYAKHEGWTDLKIKHLRQIKK